MKRRPLEGFTVEDIAAICHEANRQLQRKTGEVVNFPWESTAPALRASAVDGVRLHLEKSTTAAESHANWLRYKSHEGWRYGEVKDFAAKTHPCMVPFNDLPAIQQAKDMLFRHIVISLSEPVSE